MRTRSRVQKVGGSRRGRAQGVGPQLGHGKVTKRAGQGGDVAWWRWGGGREGGFEFLLVNKSETPPRSIKHAGKRVRLGVGEGQSRRELRAEGGAGSVRAPPKRLGRPVGAGAPPPLFGRGSRRGAPLRPPPPHTPPSPASALPRWRAADGPPSVRTRAGGGGRRRVEAARAPPDWTRTNATHWRGAGTLAANWTHTHTHAPALTAAELGAVARKPSPQLRAMVSLWGGEEEGGRGRAVREPSGVAACLPGLSSPLSTHPHTLTRRAAPAEPPGR